MKNQSAEQIDIESYYRTYGPMVLRRCRKLLYDEATAYEAMQETFVRLIHYQDRITPDAPSSLLFQMATQVCLNILRTKDRHISIDSSDDSNSDEQISKLLHEILSHDELEKKTVVRDLLSRIFGSQTESTAVMAVMFYLDEMTYEEIASEFGMSVSGVRKRLRGFNQKVDQFRSSHES